MLYEKLRDRRAVAHDGGVCQAAALHLPLKRGGRTAKQSGWGSSLTPTPPPPFQGEGVRDHAMRERKWDPRKPGAGRKPEHRAPRDKSRFAPKPKPVRPPIPDGVAILYGWHTVAAALANPRRTIRKILATENGAHRLTQGGLT